jgi:hypothetical protein
MYRHRSNISGDTSELTVQLDISRRGWIVSLPISRDAVYDLLVDLGDKIVKVQVKTMCGNSISKVVDRSNEIVCRNGKERNSLDYAEHNIDWLVGVDLSGNCYYYSLDKYKNIPSKSFSINKYPPDTFPINPQNSKTIPNKSQS